MTHQTTSLFSAPHYASFWLRLGAHTIDLLVYQIATSLLILLAVLLNLPAPEASGPTTFLYIALASALWILYKCFFLVRFAATPGQLLYGLRTIDVHGGDSPIFFQALVRSLTYFLSIALLGLGIIWIFFDPKRQTLHDKIAQTYVTQHERKDLTWPIVLTICAAVILLII